MQADWEFELGGDAPIIDALWPGLVDLRRAPELAWSLEEVGALPALAAALERLNAQSSPVWTSKCDFWPELQAKDFDPDEMDAPSGELPHAMGCYIDLLPKSDWQGSPPLAEASCRRLCAQLQTVQLRQCSVDLVVRRALVAPEREDLGITAYLTACGDTRDAAKMILEAALAAFADVLLAYSTLQ